MSYSSEEKRDMLEMYYKSHRNVNVTSETYLRKYPEREQPAKTYYLSLHRNLGEYGSFSKPQMTYNNRLNEREDDVLQAVSFT